MNNLKKFNNVAEYEAATLNYPSVSWIVSGDTVHFDKSAPVVVNDKVMIAWTSPSEEAAGKDIALWNGGVSLPPTDLFNSLTLNNVDVMSTVVNGTLENYSTPGTDYLAKYELINDTQITNIFSGDLGGGWGSSPETVDFLIPAQVTDIEDLPSNVGKVVIMVETPPTTSLGWSSFGGTIYVPDNSVSAYETAWSDANILPISQYQGNLPV